MKRERIIFLIIVLCISTYAQKHLNKIESGATTVKFNINNISTYIYGDGRADVNGSSSGFEYPKGFGKYCFYETGFVFAGREDSTKIKCGGSTFPSSMTPGKYGENHLSESNRVYRVRIDYETADFIAEVSENEFNGDIDEIRWQYKLDWHEWPWRSGAPFLDANNDGLYEPDGNGNGKYDLGEDAPGYPGADQTIWYVCNHSDSSKAYDFYLSEPMNIEMQVTIWGYAAGGALGNMLFKEYKLVNKSNHDFTDFYCGVWSDSDIGGAGDDFAGCDTILNLGYTYNSDNNDTQYGENPVAAGHVLLKANNQSHEQLMTSFTYFVNENSSSYGIDEIYVPNALYIYNLLQGKYSATGESFEVPEELGGGTTRYQLSGDPVTGIGYIDGIMKPADDRQYQVSTGPFYFPSGDNITITFAQIAAGGKDGIDRLQAVTLLKEYARKAIDFANNNFQVPRVNSVQSLSSTTNENGVYLAWGSETESYENTGYEFQGYNIYQLPKENSPITEGIRIKTFDIVDGIREITEEYLEDYATGERVIQYGNDWGIENELLVTRDHLRNTYLRPGSEYHFAITSYVYNEDDWAGTPAFESEPSYVTVTYHGEEGPDFERINVFPNPYYGANPNELNKYQRFVTFSHLPEQATIRIFNLAGQLIKTIYKTEPGQFQRWDLMNDHNFLVPGGIYIAYIEMPELGETKVLKLAVVTENIVPDSF